jgi:hypothetical protein
LGKTNYEKKEEIRGKRRSRIGGDAQEKKKKKKKKKKGEQGVQDLQQLRVFNII